MNLSLVINYLKLTVRLLSKNRVYTLINVIGLTLGFSLFLFAFILVEYETDHDDMFSNRSQIVTVGSVFTHNNNKGIKEYPNIRLAYAPIFSKEIPEALAIARAVHKIHVLSTNQEQSNNQKLSFQNIRYVDPSFTDIFQFKYLHGGVNTLNREHGIIITRTTALSLFRDIESTPSTSMNSDAISNTSKKTQVAQDLTEIIGKKIVIEHTVELTVQAIIEDLSNKSHFNSTFLPNNKLSIIAPISVLKKLNNDVDNDWQSFDPHDMTYILLPKDINSAWLQNRIESIAAKYANERELQYISRLKVRPLVEANTQIWDAFGFPVMLSLQSLGVMILLVSCLNYINLATAQSISRSREVELRKALGAEPIQLMTQFLIESLFLTLCAMILALALLELSIPLFNTLSNKSLSLDYANMLPWYIGTTVIVAIASGWYPANSITQTQQLNATYSLLSVFAKKVNTKSVSNLLITIQFSISIFMLSTVLIVYFQNQKMESLSNNYLKLPTLILNGLNRNNSGNINTTNAKSNQYEDLKNALLQINHVKSVSFSTGIPYADSGKTVIIQNRNKSNSANISLNIEIVDDSFIELYGLDLMVGKNYMQQGSEVDILASKAANKTSINNPAKFKNVYINETAANNLGFAINEGILGKTFEQVPSTNGQDATFKIIGVLKDQYFYGSHSNIPPMALAVSSDAYQFASIRLSQQYSLETLNQIDLAWSQVFPKYPIRREFLDFYFNLFFRFPEGVNKVLAGLSVIALMLALFGMFGLSMLMTQRKAKEIAMRKVLGATSSQIIRLLVWQYSRPVIWSLAIAIPASYFLSQTYIAFFPEHISYSLLLIVVASLLSMSLVYLTIFGQVMHVAKKSPVDSLRYE